MEPSQFDEFTKALATPTSRRQALKRLLAGTFGSLLALSGIGTAFAKQCPSGQTDCGGKCVDTRTDPNNCGVCGTKCRSGLCVNGLCCPPGAGKCGNSCCSLTCCGGNTCVDTQHDKNNCGSCGNKCDACSTCQNGTCVSSCPQGQTCQNGKCAPPPICSPAASDYCNALLICGPNSFCYCAQGVDGNTYCLQIYGGCSPTCSSNSDCAPGSICVSEASCCGNNVCVPKC
jgi:hypothetical protein